jgi:hypothetical protein
MGNEPDCLCGVVAAYYCEVQRGVWRPSCCRCLSELWAGKRSMSVSEYRRAKIRRVDSLIELVRLNGKE